ncbi:MAG: HAD superfamily hydrolase (TIGR01450 family) [Chlamydiales bacterium]|jgi:HAD superfamily hydrolase (TIGR01450 family)
MFSSRSFLFFLTVFSICSYAAPHAEEAQDSSDLLSSINDRSDLQNIRAVIFDMDGVLRIGYDAIDGANDLINWMDDRGIPAVVLTNECRYTSDELRRDLKHMEISFPDSWGIYTSAMAMRDFFQDHLKITKPVYVYVVGENGIRKASMQVEREGVTFTRDLPDEKLEDLSLYVVFGSVDRIQITDLENATRWIRAGAKVITTCPDVSDPSSKGSTLVGMPNHLVHMIKMYAPCVPYSIGKPHPFMIKEALRLLTEKDKTLEQNEILFVGDTIDTDIRIAFEACIPSALVLSGNTKADAIESNAVQASYVFPSVKELLEVFVESKSSTVSKNL